MCGSIPTQSNGKFSTGAIIELLHNSNWPLSTTEVADEFDVTQQGAHYRLTKLNEAGEIEKRKTSNVALWRA